MSELTKSRIQVFGLWCALGYLILVFAGWGIVAGFLPPTHPTAGPSEIAEIYAADATRIRFGMLVVMLSALVFVPFAASVARTISKIEDGPGVLTYSFLLGACGNMVLTFYPATYWLVAAFRPERAPELLQLMNDIAWLQFIGGVTMFLAMPLALAVAPLASGDRQILPRWLGYANAAIVVGIVPDQLIFFFKKGPFAWNGLFGLWVPVVFFIGFFLVNFIVIRQHVLRERSTRETTMRADATAPATRGAVS